MKAQTENSQYAVLWDLDGTIVDSAIPHKLAWKETLSRRGVNFTDIDFEWSFGRRNEEIIPKFLGKEISPQQVDAIGDEKEKTFRVVINDNIKAFPGATELIRSLSTACFQLAIVSSTPIENIELVTRTLGIKDCFKLFVSGKDVSEGKPNPQGFLLAAKKLGAQPQNCVVLEDSAAGVRAAKRGGMHCIAITNTCNKEALSEADIVVDSLEKVSVKTIIELFKHAIK